MKRTVTLLHNTKPRDSVEITVVEILPRSNDEKIVVELLQPKPDTLASSHGGGHDGEGGGGGKKGGGASSSSASGENQLKPGTVMQNKITNNVVFSKTLAPGQKVEIPFS
jgi:hypothetical protein